MLPAPGPFAANQLCPASVKFRVAFPVACLISRKWWSNKAAAYLPWGVLTLALVIKPCSSLVKAPSAQLALVCGSRAIKV